MLVAHVMHYKTTYLPFEALEAWSDMGVDTRGMVVVKTKINDVQPLLMDAWPCGSSGPACPTCLNIVFERLRGLYSSSIKLYLV